MTGNSQFETNQPKSNPVFPADLEIFEIDLAFDEESSSFSENVIARPVSECKHCNRLQIHRIDIPFDMISRYDVGLTFLLLFFYSPQLEISSLV